VGGNVVYLGIKGSRYASLKSQSVKRTVLPRRPLSWVPVTLATLAGSLMYCGFI
jgi:hypothetical protein